MLVETIGLISLIAVVVRAVQAGAANRMLQNARQHLYSCRTAEPVQLTDTELAGMPQIAQRYFRFAVGPEAYLKTVCRAELLGRWAMGAPRWPRYETYRASAILARPQEMLWTARTTGRWFATWDAFDLSVKGEHGGAFRLNVITPITDTTNLRSLILLAHNLAELLWVPAALLPRNGAQWTEVDPQTAHIRLPFRDTEITVVLAMASDGYPISLQVLDLGEAAVEQGTPPLGISTQHVGEYEGYRLPDTMSCTIPFGHANAFELLTVQLSLLEFR